MVCVGLGMSRGLWGYVLSSFSVRRSFSAPPLETDGTTMQPFLLDSSSFHPFFAVREMLRGRVERLFSAVYATAFVYASLCQWVFRSCSVVCRHFLHPLSGKTKSIYSEIVCRKRATVDDCLRHPFITVRATNLTQTIKKAFASKYKITQNKYHKIY